MRCHHDLRPHPQPPGEPRAFSITPASPTHRQHLLLLRPGLCKVCLSPEQNQPGAQRPCLGKPSTSPDIPPPSLSRPHSCMHMCAHMHAFRLARSLSCREPGLRASQAVPPSQCLETAAERAAQPSPAPGELRCLCGGRLVGREEKREKNILQNAPWKGWLRLETRPASAHCRLSLIFAFRFQATGGCRQGPWPPAGRLWPGM